MSSATAPPNDSSASTRRSSTASSRMRPCMRGASCRSRGPHPRTTATTTTAPVCSEMAHRRLPEPRCLPAGFRAGGRGGPNPVWSDVPCPCLHLDPSSAARRGPKWSVDPLVPRKAGDEGITWCFLCKVTLESGSKETHIFHYVVVNHDHTETTPPPESLIPIMTRAACCTGTRVMFIQPMCRHTNIFCGCISGTASFSGVQALTFLARNEGCLTGRLPNGSNPDQLVPVCRPGFGRTDPAKPATICHETCSCRTRTPPSRTPIQTS